MGLLGLPEPFAEVDRLLNTGDIGGAARALARTSGDAQIKELLQLKLAIATGAQSADAVTQRLIGLLKQRPDLPGAQELYAEVTRLSYESGESSVAYSHPPPPIAPKKGDPS
jgi:hypothetical protein